MRRRTALLALALLAPLGAACGQDDVQGADDEPVVTEGLDQAVEIARLSLPVSVGDDLAADLIEELCAAAGSGHVDAVVAQLQASLDPAAVPPALDAISAGAGTYCDDDVDDVVPQVRQALAPTTTAAPTVAAAAPETASGTAGGGGSPGARSSSGAPAASASGSAGAGGSTGGTSGTASNSASGSASSGGGNASGTGNSSSTDFTQGVGSSNSSSSGGGSSSSGATTG